MNTFELCPVYDSRKSFYGKAKVIHRGNSYYLYSYDTLVAVWDGTMHRKWDGYSATTARHINEFARQYEGHGYTKSQWEKVAF